MNNFIENLERSLKSGFIDKTFESNAQYQPKLLTNNYQLGLKTLTNIIELLRNCDEFWFSCVVILVKIIDFESFLGHIADFHACKNG